MSEPLYYQRGVTKGWKDQKVVHRSNGRPIPDVMEANVMEGWYFQAVRGEDGKIQARKSGDPVCRRVSGKIRIVAKERPAG